MRSEQKFYFSCIYLASSMIYSRKVFSSHYTETGINALLSKIRISLFQYITEQLHYYIQ